MLFLQTRNGEYKGVFIAGGPHRVLLFPSFFCSTAQSQGAGQEGNEVLDRKVNHELSNLVWGIQFHSDLCPTTRP